MKVVKVIAKNGRVMYFKVVDGKKKRISKEVALGAASKAKPKAKPKTKAAKAKKGKAAQPKPKAKSGKGKIYTVEEALAKKPLKGTIMVSGTILSKSYKGRGKDKQMFAFCDSVLGQCNLDSISIVMTTVKAKKFLSDINKQTKLLQLVDGESLDYDLASVPKGKIYSKDSVTLKAGWDVEGRLKIMV